MTLWEIVALAGMGYLFYLVGWWRGFRLAATRCQTCGRKHEDCDCISVELEAWDDE